jgi:hypothetical protein
MSDYSSLLKTDVEELTEKKKTEDGLFRVDFKKVTKEPKLYEATLRLLPNFYKDENGSIKKDKSIIHEKSNYVNLKDKKELNGYYTSNWSFEDETYDEFTLFWNNLRKKGKDEKNEIAEAKANSIKLNTRYYCYALVLEDSYQPELVGKIVILRFTDIIDKLIKEEITKGVNVFDLANGKDLKLKATPKSYGTVINPDYARTTFKDDSNPIKINGKAVPTVELENGKLDISEEYQEKLVNFLLKREYEISKFKPRRRTEEDENKVNKIVAYLNGENILSSSISKESFLSTPESDEEDLFEKPKEAIIPKKETTKATEVEEDDFFKQFDKA